ncbi:hypothetical protein [Nonomuraea sp. NPDC005692]|uniref:hypothetical protein n=1 Tax=Nonomuraea sp. NPDC005692 TaxID=3157168 RepID=UPI0033BFD2D2
MFIAARAVLGVGAALIMPMVIALLPVLIVVAAVRRGCPSHGPSTPGGSTTAGGRCRRRAVALVAFVIRERRAAHPLVDLSLFSSARLTAGRALGTLINFTMFGVLFTMPQYHQAVLGSDARGSRPPPASRSPCWPRPCCGVAPPARRGAAARRWPPPAHATVTRHHSK